MAEFFEGMESFESMPKLNTRYIYGRMWLRTFEKMQDARDSRDMFHVVRLFYASLIPPIRKKITAGPYRNVRGYKMFKEILDVDKILSMMPYRNGNYLVTPDIESDPKIMKVLARYGSFVNISGDKYYTPTVLDQQRYEASVEFYTVLTQALYDTGVLTYKTSVVKV